MPWKSPERRVEYKRKWLQTEAGMAYKQRERAALNRRRSSTASVIRVLKALVAELEGTSNVKQKRLVIQATSRATQKELRPG